MQKSEQIIGLDLLRFSAALMVVIYHLGVRTWSADTSMSRIVDGSVRYEPLAFAWIGWVGVEIFFALSGFVIAYSAERASALSFLRSRILRLAPAVLICATITLGVQLALGRRDVWDDYLGSVLFSPIGPWIDAPYWTLPIEIAFYAVVFVALLFNAFNRIEWIAAAVGLASSAIWALHRLGVDVVTFNTHQSNLSLLQHGCHFAIGVMLWLLLAKGFRLHRLILLSVFLAAGWLEIGFMAPMKALDGSNLHAPGLAWLGGLAFMVFSVQFRQRLSGPWNGLARQVGLATYPLYLVHAALGAWLIRLLRDHGAGPWMALAVAIMVALALSFLISWRLEPMVRRIMGRPIDVLFSRAAALRPGLAVATRPVA